MNVATENATIYVKFDIVLLPSLIAAIPNSESGFTSQDAQRQSEPIDSQ